MTKKKRPRPKRRPKGNPEKEIREFLASVPEADYANLPDDIIEVVDKAAEGVLLEFPHLANKKNPRRFRVLVRREVRAHYRAVGWEFDEEKCRAFMDLLIEYLPIFIALLAPKHPAIAAALAA